MTLGEFLFGERKKDESSSREVELAVKQYADTAGSWRTEVYHGSRLLAEEYALSKGGMIFFRHRAKAIKRAKGVLRHADIETVKVKI